MKHFYSFFLLICICPLLNAQMTFEKVLYNSAEPYEEGKDISVNSLGEMVVLTINESGTSVYKLSEQGDTIWRKKLTHSDGTVLGNRVCNGANSGYLIGGELKYGNYYDIYLLKIDDDGNKLWERRYGDNDTYNYCHDMIDIPGEGYVIAGQLSTPVTRPALLKVDINGDLLWNNSTIAVEGISDSNNFTPRAVVKIPDGYIIGGEYYKDNGVPNSAIVKFDNSGNLLMSTFTNNPDKEFIRGLNYCSDGSLAYVGRFEYEDNGALRTNLWFGKYDYNLDLLWNKNYYTSASIGDRVGEDIIEDSYGNLLIVGTKDKPDYGAIPFLAKYDATGEMFSEKIFGSNLGGHLLRIKKQGDYYYGLGYHWANSSWGVSGSNNRAFILKTDLNGDVNHLRIINSSNNICKGDEREIKVYDFMQSGEYEWHTSEDVDKTHYAIIVTSEGKYSVSAVDRNGNTRQSDTLTIFSNPIPKIISTDSFTSCGEGDKVLSTENEYASYEWFFKNEEENLVSVGSDRNYLVDIGGEYRIRVSDDNTCKNEIDEEDDIYIDAAKWTELEAFVLDSTNISIVGLSNGTATIGVKGGYPPYSYLWEESGETSKSANNLMPDHFYHVTVFDDKGCQARVSFVLKVIPVVENSRCNFSKVGGDLQLYNTNIHTIERDSEGKLWFATTAELGRYDGSNWTVTAINNVYNCLHKDKNGNIWGGSDFNDKGLNKYTGNSWKSYRKEDGLPGNNIRFIEEDKYGNLWIATDGGLTRYDGNEFVNFGISDGLLDLDLYSLHIDTKDQIWVGCNGGITRYKILNKSHIDSCTNFTYSEGKSIGGIKNITEDKSGNIWISSNWVSEGESGLLKFEDNKFIRIEPEISNSLTWIIDIYADTNGGVWIATDKGLVYFENDVWQEYSKENGLLSNNANAIGEDLLGNIWVGYNLGEGLNKYSNGDWITYNTASELLNNGIKQTTLDKDKNLWVCLDHGSYVLQKYDGTSWYGFTEEDGFSGYAYDLASDSKGNVWIATDIALYKYFNNQFEKFTTENGLLANKVLGVTVDKNDDVWIRFDDGLGINKYSNNQFVYYSINEGLLDNRIRNIQTDSIGNVWISYDGSYNKQLSKYDGTSFSKVETPVNIDGTQYPVDLMFVDSKNQVWISYQDKVSVLDNGIWSFFSETEHGISNMYTQTTFGEDAAKNIILTYYKDISEGVTEQKLIQFTGDNWVDIEPNNGLPQTEVHCIQDDFKGNLWYGTAKGLLKFTKCTNEEVLITVNNGACSGEGNRSLIITPTGGNHPYQYSINSGKTFQIDSIFTDLQADSYHLLVKNKNGELVTDRELTITEPMPLIVNIEGFNVTCKDRTDGVAICKPSGGLAPYTFLWDDVNASTTDRIENLGEGVEYNVTITDANGCTETGMVIVGHDPLLKFTDSKDVSCFGLNDGMAVITPIGGKVPFIYQWDDINTTTDSIVTTLGGGYYHFVTVTDANDCVSIDSIKLNQPEQLNVEVKSFNSCGNENSGGIEISVSGGILPYNYQWDDANNSTSRDLYNLDVGTYNITIKDYKACEVTETVVIEQLNNAEHVDIIANKGEYFCLNSTELSANGDFTSYLWSTGSTDKIIAPEAEGSYWLRIYNEDGCSDIDTISISALSTYQEQNVCLVTVNSENKNEIVWERRDGYGIDSYNVYKESNSASSYELLTNISIEENSVFTDEDSDPTSRSHTYAVSVVDICSVESKMSDAHRTMLLQASYGINGAINLSWNKYLGLDFDTYYIYRGTSLDQMELLTSISNSESKYIDNNPPEEEFLYYVLRIESPNVCEPNILKSSLEDYGISRSNIIDAGLKVTGINDKNDFVENILLYPNPLVINSFVEFDNSDFSDYQMFIYDSNGRTIFVKSGINTNKVEINRGNLASGQYIVELRGAKIFRGRLIVQ